MNCRTKNKMASEMEESIFHPWALAVESSISTSAFLYFRNVLPEQTVWKKYNPFAKDKAKKRPLLETSVNELTDAVHTSHQRRFQTKSVELSPPLLISRKAVHRLSIN